MNPNAWIEVLGWTLIHFLWQGALAAACLALFLLCARRARAQVRYTASCICLFAGVAMAGMTLARQIQRESVASRRASIEHLISSPTSSSEANNPEPSSGAAASIAFPAPDSIGTEPPGDLDSVAPIAERIRRFTPFIVASWLAGVGWFAIRLFRSWLAVQRVRQSGRPVNNAEWAARFAQLRQQLGASPVTRLLVSTAVQVPIVIGWLRPVILFPASLLTGLPAVHVEAILAHELAHIRRHDYVVNLLQNVIETLFFYHPATWWISSQIRIEREYCCDDVGAAAGGGVANYVHALASLEESRTAQPALAANTGPLLARIKRLLGVSPMEGPSHALLAGTLAILVVGAALLLPMRALQAKEEGNNPPGESSSKQPWSAVGRVTDPEGKPLPGVEIWVHTGHGSLFRTGLATTDATGRYTVNFGPGFLSSEGSDQLQIANITAHYAGWFEANLNRHGAGAAAMRDVSADQLKSYRITAKELTLPGKPRTVDFVMRRAATIKGRLLGSGSFPNLPPQDYRGRDGEKPIAGQQKLERAPLARWKVSLTGPQLPPACSILAATESDQDGYFQFSDVPAGFGWQIEADSHHSGNRPKTHVFRVGNSDELRFEFELNEKQTELKMVGPPRLPNSGAMVNRQSWIIAVVEGETGKPIPNVPVMIREVAGGPTNLPVTEAKTDANGEIPLNLPGKGMAVFGVNAPGRWGAGTYWLGHNTQQAQAQPPMPDGAQRKVVPLWRGTRVSGRLLLPDGKPAPSIPLYVSVFIDQAEWQERLDANPRGKDGAATGQINWMTSATTATDGSFEAVVPPPTVRSSFYLRTADFGPSSNYPPAVQTILGKHKPLVIEDRAREKDSKERDGMLAFGDIRLSEGMNVRGRVLDVDGRPVAGIAVQSSDVRGTFSAPPVFCNEAGQFELLRMSPGMVRISANAPFAQGRPVLPFEARPVFIASEVSIPTKTEGFEIEIRAVPHTVVEFEWKDRRSGKLPVSAMGGFTVSGQVPRAGSAPQNWNGRMELHEKDGKPILRIKVPTDLKNATLALPADILVTPSYEDELTKFGPGNGPIGNLTTPMRRVIYGDAPTKRP